MNNYITKEMHILVGFYKEAVEQETFLNDMILEEALEDVLNGIASSEVSSFYVEAIEEVEDGPIISWATIKVQWGCLATLTKEEVEAEFAETVDFLEGEPLFILTK